MSDYVTLRHPTLPEDQTITVAASAVPHHRAAGWVPVDPPPPEPQDAADPAAADTPKPPAAASAAPDPKPARSRRRATEGE
ncbi:hypothetical protein ACFWR9_11560 [Streptomyces sp. NPDC058534]|uniref:hypothetical protein n=1 Tax=Streptomyces sp. NPDC058534 TaxID=3346541 RepID=UPI003658A302